MKKILRIIPLVISFIVFAVTIFFISDLNVLPNKYLYTFIISDFILLGLTAFIYYQKKKVFQIIGIVLIIIFLIGNIFLSYYLYHTNKYMNDNFSIPSHKERISYLVVTSNNNPVNGLEEVENQEVYYYKYSRATSLAMKKLGNYNYSSLDKGFESLRQIRDENKYFLIAKLDYDFILSTTDELNDDQFKKINEFDVLEETKINEEIKDSYNIFVGGMDYSRYRRDYNAIITVNTKTHKILITSLSRDLYLYVPAYDAKDSLTSLGSADPNNTIEALENLFNIKIDYSVNLYTESLVNVVDSLGGIDFCTDFSFYTTHDTTLGSYNDWGERVFVEKGCHTYNGLEALAIARERVRLVGTGVSREDNCRQILINIGKKIASTVNLSNYTEILDSFNGVYTSNINKKTITNLIKSGIDNMNYEILEQSIKGWDHIASSRGGTGEVYAIVPYDDSVSEISQKINEIINEK